MYRKM